MALKTENLYVNNILDITDVCESQWMVFDRLGCRLNIPSTSETTREILEDEAHMQTLATPLELDR